MNRTEKEQTIAELAERLGRANAAILTDFRGLKVSQITDLRRKLRESKAEYRVVKNTLMRKAAQGTQVEPILANIQGPCALALSFQDPVAAAKAVTEFAAAPGQENLKIMAGVIEGRLISAAQVAQLAKIPPREVLLAQLLGLLNMLPTRLVRTLNAIPAKLLYALQAIREEKDKASQA